jgi:hypothetical protein
MRLKKAPVQDSRSWKWLTTPWGIVVVIGSVIGAFLLNINAVLSNVRNLPGEIGTTINQFSSWYYEDAEWKGYWTNNPQVYVNAADMDLSPDKFVIDMKVEYGVIDGTIATPQICDATPFYDFFLLRGRVSKFSDTATAVVWDTFEGHDQDIATLELKRDGIVMSVVPKEGSVQLFPKTARIAIDLSVVRTFGAGCGVA